MFFTNVRNVCTPFCAWVESQRDGSCCEMLSLKPREQLRQLALELEYMRREEVKFKHTTSFDLSSYTRL